MSARNRTAAWVDDALVVATSVMSAVVGLALVVLAVRSYTRLEIRWDTWHYHLAYAAKAGRLGIPFHMDIQLAARFEGYPPLAHIVEGLLWRTTGSVNATGVINMLGLGGFLFVCHRLVRAPFYIVGLIALTAPMVVIHAATNYIDLWSNAFLAIGLVVLIHVYLNDRQSDRALLAVGLGGVAVAGLSKLPLIPIAAVTFVLYAIVYRLWARGGAQQVWSRWTFGLVGFVAAFPFVRNLVVYGNPLWPKNVPIFGGEPGPIGGSIAYTPALQRPPSLAGKSQPELFVRSMLEIGHPWRYDDRPRWILDQGGGDLAYRSGGFWFVGVLVFLALMVGLLLRHGGPRGRVVAVASGVALVAVAFLPESHVLRYYMFIPLVWAGVIGMLFPPLRRVQPVAALGLCALMLAMFWTMFRANQSYFRIERESYADAAQFWGGARLWPKMRAGDVYCDVRTQGGAPRGLTLTGPTMREFTVYVRPLVSQCPPGSVPIIGDVVHDELRR